MIFFAGILVYNIGLGPINGAGLIYSVMILYWGRAAVRRSGVKAIRVRLLLIAAMMLLLLLLRGIRYRFTGVLPPPMIRELWYLYYLPFTMIPLLSLDAALLVGDDTNHRFRHVLPVLYAFCLLLNLLILSNGLHQLAFRFTDAGRQQEYGLRYEYGPVYYAAVVWIAGCTGAMLHHLILENRAVDDRRIPWSLLSILIIPGAYFLTYYLGLFPMLRGRRIVQLPEAYCIFFICLLEYCLQLGWFPVQILRRKELEVREAALDYERRNQLYVSMASAVTDQLVQVSGLLQLEDREDEAFRPAMARACVLTAYIKRRCNMVLKASEQERMPLEELRFSIAESLEYLQLCGVTGAVFSEDSGAELPGEVLIAAYDVFEKAAELAMQGAEALMANIRSDGCGISLRLTLEHPSVPPSGALMENAALRADENTYYISWESLPEAGAAEEAPSGGETAAVPAAPSAAAPFETVASAAPASAAAASRAGASELALEFSELGRLITAYTIEKEQLDARIRLHDDLGKMLLLAKRYIQGKGDRASMLAVWQSSRRLLETDTKDPAEDGYAYMRVVAQDVGIRLNIQGELPQDPALSELVVTAIHECLTNTIRHARGEELNVVSREGRIEITNDGIPPAQPIAESGGLGMLRRKAEAMGVEMKIDSVPGFRLTLTLNRGETNV